MKAEDPRERAKARALRLLEKRDYSKAELAAKLVEKGDNILSFSFSCILSMK